MYVTYNKAVDF